MNPVEAAVPFCSRAYKAVPPQQPELHGEEKLQYVNVSPIKASLPAPDALQHDLAGTNSVIRSPKPLLEGWQIRLDMQGKQWYLHESTGTYQSKPPSTKTKLMRVRYATATAAAVLASPSDHRRPSRARRDEMEDQMLVQSEGHARSGGPGGIAEDSGARTGELEGTVDEGKGHAAGRNVSVHGSNVPYDDQGGSRNGGFESNIFCPQ